MQQNTYLLGVGEQGSYRLDLLHELFEPISTAFLSQAGIKQGNTVLEIGCGNGNMTCWLAEQVGSEGHIYAIDNSAEQITLAKKRCLQKGLTNITFITSSILNIKDLPKVDYAYSRFVLVHLDNPAEALRIMLNSLKAGGFLLCEEASNSGYFCYPILPAVVKSRELLIELCKKKQLNPNLGDSIYSLYYKMNIKIESVNFVQPIYQTQKHKLLVPLTLVEAQKSVIDEGLATHNEIEELIETLYTIVEDSSNLFSFPRTTQICGQKLSDTCT